VNTSPEDRYFRCYFSFLSLLFGSDNSAKLSDAALIIAEHFNLKPIAVIYRECTEAGETCRSANITTTMLDRPDKETQKIIDKIRESLGRFEYRYDEVIKYLEKKEDAAVIELNDGFNAAVIIAKVKSR